jgi:hypothetical protein
MWGVLSLTKERVCRLQLQLVLASAVILRSEPSGRGWPDYTPQALGSVFVASYDSQGYGGGMRTRLQTGDGLTLPAIPLSFARVTVSNRKSVVSMYNLHVIKCTSLYSYIQHI